MSWLTPLGFLGFLGLVALIVIYVIKPNYQHKIISSTFIWKLSLKFKKKKILQTAFVHSSYSNEHRIESNERLEFLGDAVIEFIITEILYLQFQGREGDMSKIRSLVVSEKPLSEAIDKLGLSKYLLNGVGESKNTTESKAVKCDLFEALVGAIFLDGGIENAKAFFRVVSSR